MFRRTAFSLAAAAVASVLVAEPALGHGIHESAAGKSVIEFVPLGIEHMLLGWDHLLFITGVVILSGNLRRAAKLISLFAVGHSLTLLIATIAGWKLNATFVDVIIALSLVYVGIQGVRAHRDPTSSERTANWRLIGTIIFAFGLVHGLGLSTRLQDLGLPDDGLVWRVIAFNVGVEIGQLLALAVVIAVGYFVIPAVDWPRVRRAAYLMLAVTGVIAAGVLALPDGEGDASATRTGVACEQTDVDPPGTLAGGHPPKRFYAPGEEAPTTDLEHVIGDGFIVVRYRPDIGAADQRRLEQWLGTSSLLIAAPAEDQDETIKATTAYRELACDRFDMTGLTEFTNEWLADVKAGRAQ